MRWFLLGAVAAPFVIVALVVLVPYWWVAVALVGAVVTIGGLLALVEWAGAVRRAAADENRRIAATVWPHRDAPTEAADEGPPFTDARVDLARHRALRGRFDGWRYRSPVAGAGVGPTPTRSAGAESPPP